MIQIEYKVFHGPNLGPLPVSVMRKTDDEAWVFLSGAGSFATEQAARLAIARAIIEDRDAAVRLDLPYIISGTTIYVGPR